MITVVLHYLATFY